MSTLTNVAEATDTSEVAELASLTCPTAPVPGGLCGMDYIQVLLQCKRSAASAEWLARA